MSNHSEVDIKLSETSKPPEKPKHYVRDQWIIAALALVIMTLLLMTDAESLYVVMMPIWFNVIASGFWFKKYNKQKQNYDLQTYQNFLKRREEQRLRNPNFTDVNQNIAQYVEAERQKREQASWWQFWV